MTILIVMIGLVLVGGLLALFNQVWGLVPFFLGVLMAFGFKELDDSPRQVGLISFCGIKTPCIVEGLTLIFKPFGLKIVDVVVFDATQQDLTFDVSVTCCDDGIVSGKVSLSYKPNTTVGTQLIKYDNIGGTPEKLKAQLDDIVETACQTIADCNTTEAMVRDSRGLGITIWSLIRGSIGDPTDTNDLDDTTGLGIETIKLQAKLAKSSRVSEAEQKALATAVMEKRIAQRFAAHRLWGTSPMPSAATVRENLMEEDRNADGQITEIRGGELRNVSINNRN